jgi:hypothetical protein
MLTKYKKHHQKADIDRLYVKRKEGGRGLVQVKAAYKREIINIAEYLNTKYKGDQFVNIVKNQESTQPSMNSIVKFSVLSFGCFPGVWFLLTDVSELSICCFFKADLP